MRISTTLLGRLAAAGLALAIPVSAQAGSGYLSVNVNLRAGPAIGYPAIRVAPRGSVVNIYGCLDDYGWCDVSWDGYRGWVSGNYLDYGWNGRRVPVYSYGPRLGLGIISFNFGNYWDSHYRQQPWYGQRDRYQRVVIRHNSSRNHGYYAPRHNTRTAIRYDRRDHRQVNRRDVRQDIRHDRRDVRHDRRDVRQDRRDVRQDSRQVHQVRQDQRQVRQQSRNVRQDVRQERTQNRSVARQDGRSSRHGGSQGTLIDSVAMSR